jgi:predicted esterase
MRSIIRPLLFASGVLAALPLLVVLLLLPTTPITLVGSIYLVGAVLIVGGMIAAPVWRRSAILALLGAGIIATTVSLRMVFPASGARLVLATFPGQAPPRWWNRVFDEQDAVLFGARLGSYVGLISPAENNGLVPALAQAYGEMREATPLSPFLTTYLDQQQPEAFDALLSEPAAAAPPKQAIVFLHGFGGNFTLQCWLVAHAGGALGMLTICPSTGPSGNWWSASGEAILKQTLADLERRGVERIYLAGLSNGGIGASRLAQRFENRLAGLILISGADPEATITKLPVLVVQGDADERIPRSMVEQYVAAAGASDTYLLLKGDHFVLLKQSDQVQRAIVNWLVQQEAH